MVKIIESYLMSKTGKPDGGEDRLILGPNFYGVVDGSTDKSGLNWGTKEEAKKGGAVLADIVKEVLENPGTKIDHKKIVEIINKKINYAAEKANIDLGKLENRADAGFTVYVPEKNVIYHIHDCNYAFLKRDGTFEMHDNDKPVDKLLSALRQAHISWCISQGIDPFKDGRDLGREHIMPYLKRQPEIQNQGFDDEKEWIAGVKRKDVAYKTLNGFPTTLDIIPVPEDTKEIILLTDGFPVIKHTLKETIEVLNQYLKQDPHCISVIKSRKMLQPGYRSYDDMGYLRISLGS